MLKQSVTPWGTDLPFSRKTVVSRTMNKQDVICSETLFCRQLFAGHVWVSRPQKMKENATNDNICSYTLGFVIIM